MAILYLVCSQWTGFSPLYLHAFRHRTVSVENRIERCTVLYIRTGAETRFLKIPGMCGGNSHKSQ